jgi:dihydropteroate synthase
MNQDIFMYSLGIALASLKEEKLSEIEEQAVADLSYAHELGYTCTMQHFLSWLIPEENLEKELANALDKEYAVCIRKVWEMTKGGENAK